MRGRERWARAPLGESACVAKLAHVESESRFCISRLMKSLLEQSFDLALRGRTTDRSHAGLPAGGALDVFRQAGGAHEALGVGNRPLVERSDALCQRVDETVEFAV